MRHDVAVERGRLAADGRDVVLPAARGLEGRADLAHLSLAEPAQRVGQQRGDVGAESGGDGGAAGQEVVAGDDGDEIPETAVDTLDVAPDRCLVDDVVVVQGGEVDELHGHPAHQVVLRGVPVASRRRGQGEEGPQPLAPRRDQVGRDLIQEAVARHDRGREQGFQASQSLLHTGQAEGLGGVHSPKR